MRVNIVDKYSMKLHCLAMFMRGMFLSAALVIWMFSLNDARAVANLLDEYDHSIAWVFAAMWSVIFIGLIISFVIFITYRSSSFTLHNRDDNVEEIITVCDNGKYLMGVEGRTIEFKADTSFDSKIDRAVLNIRQSSVDVVIPMKSTLV